MPDGDNTLYLCDPEAPSLEGLRTLSTLPGRAGVLMHVGEKRGLVYAPGSGRLNPDVGVLCYGEIGIAPGTEVIVQPYHGKWLDDWHDGRQLRLYGVASKWHDSIIAVRTPLGIEPTHDWILLKREDNEGYKFLPDTMRFSDSKASVLQLGPRCSMLPLGARVIFKPDIHKKALRFAFGADPACILIREQDVLAQIVDANA